MSSPTPLVPKESRLSIRASEADKAILSRAARVRRMNTSQFVLQASLDVARTVVAEQTEFRLSPEQWEAFCRRLDAPPQANPALERLFSEPEPFDV